MVLTTIHRDNKENEYTFVAKISDLGDSIYLQPLLLIIVFKILKVLNIK